MRSQVKLLPQNCRDRQVDTVNLLKLTCRKGDLHGDHRAGNLSYNWGSAGGSAWLVWEVKALGTQS